MKKLLLIPLCLGGLAFSSCTANKSDTINTESRVIDILARQAVSSVSSLSNYNSLLANKIVTDEELKNSIDYLKQAEILLENEVKVEEISVSESEYLEAYLASYDSKIYTLYITSLKTEEESEDDEYEVEKKYTGIINYEERSYDFTLTYKTEQEENEYEDEVTFKMKVNENSFITIEKGYETEENEYEEYFSYKSEINGIKESYKVKKEIEENENTLVVKFDNLEYKYSFYTENEKEYVKVKIDGYDSFTLLKTIDNDGEAMYSLTE